MNFNYIWMQHFVQRPPQAEALSFITLEGLILSAAVALLFINHSQGSIKRWLMVDTALSSHFSDVGSSSRVRPGGEAPCRFVTGVCAHLSPAAFFTEAAHQSSWPCVPNTHWAWRSASLLWGSWPCLIGNRKSKLWSAYPYSHWRRTFYLLDLDGNVKNVILSAAVPRWEEEEAFAREGVCFWTAGY